MRKSNLLMLCCLIIFLGCNNDVPDPAIKGDVSIIKLTSADFKGGRSIPLMARIFPRRWPGLMFRLAPRHWLLSAMTPMRRLVSGFIGWFIISL